ncbi:MULTISPECIES: HAD family hydrolase [unclassified Levilactobacillus]|uniref:HAD family hydrolase n=1 Tax=unclassified Levilactobacillus TaxID=2767918 RepID=UPI002FF2282D
MINYLFSDLDGTLLDATGRVSQNTINTIQDSHLPLTLVSARAPIEMLPALTALNLMGPQIAFNGGLIFQYQDDQIISLRSHPLTASRTREILGFVQTHFPQVSLSCYTQDNWYTERIDGGTHAEQALTGQTAQLTTYAELFNSSEITFYKIMIMSLDTALLRQLVAALVQLGDTDISIKLSGSHYLEITSRDAQKSTGVQFIKDYYHLKTAETAAFGDGENDLPMLHAVGTAVVMGNAAPAIKDHGDWVTTSNTEDGVAYAIQYYLRGE